MHRSSRISSAVLVLAIGGCFDAADSSQLDAEDDGAPADDGDEEDCRGAEDWDPAWTQFENQVLDLVNEARVAGAVCGGQQFAPTTALVLHPTLRCSARLHSLDMAERITSSLLR